MNIFKLLAHKPWLQEAGASSELQAESLAVSNQKVALMIFLGVVGILFFLFFAAYHMRIELSNDWVPIPEPPMLWVNTVVLVIASIAFEVARSAANRARLGSARAAFFGAGLLTITFLVLQLMVWNQMIALGYYAQANPANAFFYLLTAVHGVHLLGGLVAWGRAAWRFVGSDEPGKIARSVDLCAWYWHFLLLVWVGVFAMFMNT